MPPRQARVKPLPMSRQVRAAQQRPRAPEVKQLLTQHVLKRCADSKLLAQPVWRGPMLRHRLGLVLVWVPRAPQPDSVVFLTPRGLQLNRPPQAV